MNDTTTHCPGHEPFKSIQPIEVTCKKCGTVNEVFSDEVEKTHTCSKCKEILNVKKATT
jgi:predicted Zn-ribbon and HTH transcriptional regulator